MTMKENNQISLSFEMYEDLKDTLVKAIKNTKAGGAGNAGWRMPSWNGSSG